MRWRPWRTATITLVVLLAAGACATSADPPRTLVVLGDSIAAGSAYGGQGAAGFPALLARSVGWFGWTTGVGGTGYVASRPEAPSYEAAQAGRVEGARPSLVIVEGSGNDVGRATPQQVSDAATRLWTRLRARLPDSRLVVVGPIAASEAAARSVEPYSRALSEAAARVGVPFVDPDAEDWLVHPDPSMVGPDGVHPTDAGHRRIAERLRADLVRLGALT